MTDSDPTKLYELSEDGEKALREIEASYGAGGDEETGRESLSTAVAELLTKDDYVRPEVIDTIINAYEAAEGTGWVRGPLGLYLALNTATELALSVVADGERRRAIESMLAEPSTVECFRSFYSIKKAYDLDKAKLHRIGTTSLILCCPLADQVGPPQVVALKCLLPRYHRVKAILERTNDYQKEHTVKSQVAPYVIDSTPLTITMEFVEGETLAERFKARIGRRQALGGTEAHKRALHDDDIKFVREVGLEICRCLSELAAEGKEHLDLSPSNIIVVSDERDYRLRIRLIDFGQNFAITERVGSAVAYRQAALYVAPELIHGTDTGNWRCDAYSLGVILLEAAALSGLRKEDLALELERLWQGERPWEGAPQVGRIVDELLDEDSAQRLMLYDGPDRPRPAYEYLQKLIYQETEVLEQYKDQTEGSGFGLLHGFGLLKVYKNTQLVNLLRAARASEESVDDAYADFPALARWAIVAMITWVLAAAAFAMMTLADLHWGTVKPWAEQIAEAFGHRFEVGSFWANLPGRLVALTFAVTAVTYYVNNLATLSPKRIGLRIGWMSEVLMRLTSFIFALPLLYVMLCDPDAWPLIAGAATLLVAWNNYVALRIGSRAFEVFQVHCTPKGSAGYKFIHEVFKEWWVLMLWYGFAMLGIGVLLKFDVAHDEAIFAVLVIIANVVKLYRTNCVQAAPQVRGCLSRAILTLRRANRLSSVVVQDPSVSQERSRPLAAISRWWWKAPLSIRERHRRWRRRLTASQPQTGILPLGR